MDESNSRYSLVWAPTLQILWVKLCAPCKILWVFEEEEFVDVYKQEAAVRAQAQHWNQAKFIMITFSLVKLWK